MIADQRLQIWGFFQYQKSFWLFFNLFAFFPKFIE